MALRIHSNVDAMTVQRNLLQVVAEMGGHQARLSSGLRVSRGADDAAALAISERMHADSRSMRSARRNLEDALGLVREAENNLGALGVIAIRMKELAVQGSNGTLSDADRENLDAEYHALVGEYDRVVGSASFFGIRLFAHDRAIEVQAGTDAGETLSIELRRLPGSAAEFHSFSFATLEGAQEIHELANSALRVTNAERGRFAAMENQLESALRGIRQSEESTEVATSRIQDADVALEVAALVRLEVRQSVGFSSLVHANFRPGLALVLLNGIQSQFEEFAPDSEAEAAEEREPRPIGAPLGERTGWLANAPGV